MGSIYNFGKVHRLTCEYKKVWWHISKYKQSMLLDPFLLFFRKTSLEVYNFGKVLGSIYNFGEVYRLTCEYKKVWWHISKYKKSMLLDPYLLFFRKTSLEICLSKLLFYGNNLFEKECKATIVNISARN